MSTGIKVSKLQQTSHQVIGLMKKELQLLEKIPEKGEANILLMQESLMLAKATIQLQNQVIETNKPGNSKTNMNIINN